MTAQQPAWDGRPENPGRDGWHWLHWQGLAEPEPVWWDSVLCEWSQGEEHNLSTKVARYLGPCATPAEAQELRARLELAEAAQTATATSRDLWQRLYDEALIACQSAEAERDAARAAALDKERLRAALRPFLTACDQASWRVVDGEEMKRVLVAPTAIGRARAALDGAP